MEGNFHGLFVLMHRLAPEPVQDTLYEPPGAGVPVVPADTVWVERDEWVVWGECEEFSGLGG